MDITPRTKEENRAAWFWMVMSYMKFKTLELWLRCFPDISYESFEAIWPTLLDRMLRNATRETARKLREKIEQSSN